MIPVLKRCHHRHVVGFKHIQAGGEHIGQLAFVYKHSRLPFADCQLGTVLDFVIVPFEPPDHRVAGVIGPVNNVDELTAQKIENRHGQKLLFLARANAGDLVAGQSRGKAAYNGHRLFGCHARRQRRIIQYLQQILVMCGE